MINLYHNMNKRQQNGMATLVITVIILAGALLIIGYAANYTLLQQKTATNQYANNQAFDAAEAGIDYGTVYLSQNNATIKATASGGIINYGASDSNLTNVALSNNRRFSVVYTNPTANNYQLMLVSATGTSADGTATQTMSQLVRSQDSTLQYTLTTRGGANANGNAEITGNLGINAGGAVTISGSSSVSNYQQNVGALSSISTDAFFSSIFSQSKASMQAQSTVYSNSSGVPWSSLSGTVWIDSNVNLNSNAVIGSMTEPVLLIVNGNFDVNGTVTFYGLLYIAGTYSSSGNFTLNGGVAAEGNINVTGSSIGGNTDLVNQVLGANTYSRVGGGWKDF